MYVYGVIYSVDWRPLRIIITYMSRKQTELPCIQYHEGLSSCINRPSNQLPTLLDVCDLPLVCAPSRMGSVPDTQLICTYKLLPHTHTHVRLGSCAGGEIQSVTVRN